MWGTEQTDGLGAEEVLRDSPPPTPVLVTGPSLLGSWEFGGGRNSSGSCVGAWPGRKKLWLLWGSVSPSSSPGTLASLLAVAPGSVPPASFCLSLALSGTLSSLSPLCLPLHIPLSLSPISPSLSACVSFVFVLSWPHI